MGYRKGEKTVETSHYSLFTGPTHRVHMCIYKPAKAVKEVYEQASQGTVVVT
jgi:hypothetical protein